MAQGMRRPSIKSGETSMSNIDVATKELLAVRSSGGLVSTDFVAAHPLSAAEGLQVQDNISKVAGPVGGWKVAPGSTPEAPNFGAVFARDIYGASETFETGRFRSMGIECEIAFRIGKDLREGSYTRDQVANAIESVVPLMEIAESRLVDRKSASIGWPLADGGGNGAFLIGTAISDWKSVNTQQQPVTLTFNGKVVAEAEGNPRPDLIAIVTLLVNQAGKLCGGVCAGQIVTTGSMSGNIATEPGTDVLATFSNLGELRAKFG
jgi:2-keto-4-pentenoate hydratase